MASNLAAALLGAEGGGAGGFSDPNVAAALPDIQLGQSLQQGSLSTAPASPWQALARVAQAAAGGYIQKSAISDLGKIYAHTADNAAATLPEGHPLKAALKSEDPTIRMEGLKAYQKALTLMSEPSNIGAGEQRVIGTQPVFTSGQPVSPEGKQVKDAAALAAGGNRAAANAITSKLSKEGQIGETGVAAPSIPLNPPRFGGMQSVVGSGPGGPGTPSAQPARVPLTAPNLAATAGPSPPAGVPLSAPQVPPMAKPPAVSPPTSNLQPTIPQATPDQMSAAKAQLGEKLQKVADSGVTNPSATGISNLPEQIAASKGAQTDATKTAEANAKYYDSLHRGLSGSAMIAAQQKQNIGLLRDIAASPNFTPGAGSDQALALQRLAAQFNINPQGAAPRELFNQVAARVLADQMSGIKSMASETGETGGRIFKPMLDLEEKANITHEDTLAGIKSKLDLLDKSGDLMMKWGAKADDYLKNHPRLDAEFDKGLRADIAGARIPNIVPDAKGAASSGTKPVAPAAGKPDRAAIEAEMKRRGFL